METHAAIYGKMLLLAFSPLRFYGLCFNSSVRQ